MGSNFFFGGGGGGSPLLGLCLLLWPHSQAVWNWDNASWDADDSSPAVRLGAASVEEQGRREVSELARKD